MQPDQPDLATQLVDDIVRSCPDHRPGTRPTHASGIAATGCFSATPVASSFTTAAHMAGEQVPVTVRFSNGAGDLIEPDSTPAVRGMAVKFHLGAATHDDWGVLHSEIETDLVAMTLPMFFAKSVDRFREFVTAATPVLPKARTRGQKLIETLRLATPYPTPPLGIPSNEQGVFDFAVGYPPACPAAAYLGAKFVPESYTTCSYHAVHAFALTGPDGTIRYARFHWEPVEGVRSAPPGAQGNFLRDGLQERVTNDRAQFVLRMQLAEDGDDLDDPTRPWALRRPRVVMGNLRLTAIPEDQYHGCELLSFNPARLVPGIDLSHDPILAVRGKTYECSYARRLHAAQATHH